MFYSQFMGVTTIHGDKVLINPLQITHVVFSTTDSENANVHMVGSDKIVVVPRSQLVGLLPEPPEDN